MRKDANLRNGKLSSLHYSNHIITKKMVCDRLWFGKFLLKGKKMPFEYLYTAPLTRGFLEVFRDFCVEKKVSDKKIREVLEQAINDLASDLGFEIRLEEKRPAGIEVMLSEWNREPMVVI